MNKKFPSAEDSMPNLPEIDTPFLLDFLTKLLNTPSPTGFAEAAIAFTEETFKAFPSLQLARTRKGALTATWRGGTDESPRAVTAHVDTLGGMVKEVKSNGRLKLSKIGGFVWNTIEGEGCSVFTRSGRQVRGSILLTKASSHVHGVEVGDGGIFFRHIRIAADDSPAVSEYADNTSVFPMGLTILE